VCAIVAERAELVPVVLAALRRAGERRGHGCRLHVVAGSERWVPPEWLAERVRVRRAAGDVEEPLADVLPVEELGREWEWEETPELSLDVVPSLEHAIERFNRYSPRFVASLIARDPAEHERFFAAVDAPFVGDGFTRWVDGQWALGRPELGLSNWQHGRLLARSGVLSGDGIYTVRTRAQQGDPDLHR
jgi:glutamate-5-semialdehyde dehydrogenase